MVDVFSPEQRSAVMRAVKSRDTGPELRVRRAAHALGLRFRLRRDDLPGKPDLVFPKHGVALFVHGCFWHGHDCPRGARTPAANAAYWTAKIARNGARDAAAITALKAAGWRTATIWECETKEAEVLRALLARRIPSPAFRRLARKV